MVCRSPVVAPFGERDQRGREGASLVGEQVVARYLGWRSAKEMVLKELDEFLLARVEGACGRSAGSARWSCPARNSRSQSTADP